MMSFAGVSAEAKGKMSRVFMLTNEGICHTIIFANVLWHDLDIGSVVPDTCVVPLTYGKLFDLYDSLGELSQRETCRIVLSKVQSILRRCLIPTLVERRRTSPHRKSCEYQKKGGVTPLSIEEHATPLCSCGEGKDLPPGFAKGDDA